MKVEINLKKRYFIFILVSALLIGGLIAVYAYGTNNPSVFGHSANELTGVCLSSGVGCPVDLGGGGVSAGSGVDFVDIRAGLEYIPCTALGVQGRPVSCTARCTSPKKVISGSCSATMDPPTNNAIFPSLVANSAPSDDKLGWVCTAAQGSTSETPTVTGLAICL